jgi:fatty acid desaturase
MAPHDRSRQARIAESVRGFFWVAVIALIGLFVFLAALGAFNPLDAVGLTAVIVVLLVLWLIHAWTLRVHHAEVSNDPRLKSARERRGF